MHKNTLKYVCAVDVLNFKSNQLNARSNGLFKVCNTKLLFPNRELKKYTTVTHNITSVNSSRHKPW